MKNKTVDIELREWDYTCGDGCCYLSGTKLFVNGKQLDDPIDEECDNNYLGDNVELAIRAVCKELGYSVNISRTSGDE